MDMNISSEAEKEKKYLVSVRRHLHRNPELSLREFKTAAFIEQQLDSFGIAHRRVGETGVLGTITGKTGSGKTVLLRADIDALPIDEQTNAPFASQTVGVMHACGHDVHTASLLGAAKVLQSLRSTFSGQVQLVFQPAEEFGHGSKFFLAEKITEGADRAFGIHVSPNIPVGAVAMGRGAVMASCDYFKITIHGKEAHITNPGNGIDALYIASLIVTELKTLVQQLVDPSETALIGVGKIVSGSSYNIIAGEAVLEGTTRTFSYETQDLLKEKITSLTVSVAENNGAGATVEFETFTSALIDDDTAYDEVYAVADALLGAENIVTDKAKIVSLGADDFAEYIRNVKGVYVFVGSSDPQDPRTQYPLHCSKFDVDEQALLIAASLHIQYALSVLKDE